mmetsp:Transcript_15685/g.49269  ORF Transcript_15685/g.49269 Transcript_15685/m.49269 type:complete len:274 (+) Transcript_15685:409-1230(+)
MILSVWERIAGAARAPESGLTTAREPSNEAVRSHLPPGEKSTQRTSSAWCRSSTTALPVPTSSTLHPPDTSPTARFPPAAARADMATPPPGGCSSRAALFPRRRSHMRTTPSAPAVITAWSPWVHMAATAPVCPARAAVGAPISTSHSRTAKSPAPPDTRTSPPGPAKATARTVPVCPLSTVAGATDVPSCPLSHGRTTLTVWSLDPLATRRPAPSHATQYREPWWWPALSFRSEDDRAARSPRSAPAGGSWYTRSARELVPTARCPPAPAGE